MVYDLLIREAAHALQALADDPRWVGATLGVLAVLHTWRRDLAYHPHVHLLVTAGGLKDDGSAWRVPANPDFLVPGYALATIFRAKVRDALEEAQLLDDIDPDLFRQPWVVHLQHAGDGEHAAEYLSRYVHRVAITDDRLERFDGERVTFRYVSTRTQEAKRLTLATQDFLARFLQHVLPKGFAKVRAYGLFSPACSDRRERARHLLAVHHAAILRPPDRRPDGPTDCGPRLCPVCAHGHLRRQWACHRPLDLVSTPTASLARPPP